MTKPSGLTPAQVEGALNAVYDWLNAAATSVKILDNFGEHAAAERAEATITSIEKVINEAIDGIAEAEEFLAGEPAEPQMSRVLQLFGGGDSTQ